MEHCLYLRKSRADAEAELRGEGETLARHEKILLELAQKLHLTITAIYREVVSGETIAARPIMQQLLQEVEQGRWDGVLVMEIERLARGDTIDQGIMAQTFKYSDTAIITPLKTYHPNDEFDEEYFEFGLFMSRREYKTINRRLQRGRVTSAKEGKYLGNKPPYGYQRIKLEQEKGWSLEPIPEEAEVVKLIFAWYTQGEQQPDGSYQRLGTSLIAKKLNTMGLLSKTNIPWAPSSIRDILSNPVYIGKIRWGYRPAVKKMVDGQMVQRRLSKNPDTCTLADGLHPPLIEQATFDLAQAYRQENTSSPVPHRSTLKNPLAGIVICGKCGHAMVRRPYAKHDQPDTLLCATSYCDTVSSALHFVEENILQSLAEWLQEYQVQWKNSPQKTTSQPSKQALEKKLQKELHTLSQQLDNTYNLLEQGIYTTEVFVERSRLLSEKIANKKQSLAAIQQEIAMEKQQKETRESLLPKVEHLLSVYHTLPTPKAKNDMLKEVLEKVIYNKSLKGRWHNKPDAFTLTLYPKLPPK